MPGCVAVDTTFQAAYEWAKALQSYPDQRSVVAPDVGCATAPARSLFGAVQDFRFPLLAPGIVIRHYMIWRSDTKTIYVIRVDDPRTKLSRGWVYPDIWVEGMPQVPPACADIAPPAETYPPSPGSGIELRLPIRGFGKVWCDHRLWDTVGWATEDESGVPITIQPAQQGVMIRAGALAILLDDMGRAIVCAC